MLTKTGIKNSLVAFLVKVFTKIISLHYATALDGIINYNPKG